MNTLVVYYSRKGYVKKIALDTAEKLDANTYEIIPKERTKGILGFWWCGRFGMHQWGMPIEKCNLDLSDYDHVILCSPIWVFSVSAPMRQFILEQKGKIKNVSYILVHFSLPMGYKNELHQMDEALSLTHTGFESIVCCFGKILKRRIIK